MYFDLPKVTQSWQSWEILNLYKQPARPSLPSLPSFRTHTLLKVCWTKDWAAPWDRESQPEPDSLGIPEWKLHVPGWEIGTFHQGQWSSVFEQPRLGCVGIQVAFILSGSGRHSLWHSPTARMVPGVCGGTLRRLGAPGETFIFPELYHFFHNTILPSRWKVPAGGWGHFQCAFVHSAPAQEAGFWAPPFLYQPVQTCSTGRRCNRDEPLIPRD